MCLISLFVCLNGIKRDMVANLLDHTSEGDHFFFFYRREGYH